MVIKTGAVREHTIGWGIFLCSYAVIYAITLFMGRFVDASWDIRLLLFLNPDSYIPVLDELVILQTDFATYYFVLLLLAWQIGYYSIRRCGRRAQQRARVVFYALSVFFGVWHALGIVVHERGIFWWGEYEYPIIFLPLGLAFTAGFVLAGNLYLWLSREDQRKLAHAFWLTLFAVFFVNVLGEDPIKEIIGRHRPLHSTYEQWNSQVRILPDEIVRASYSYISGHTSSFWALVMIYFWLFKSTKIRIVLVLWAVFHGYTRIYTAAHFPYCVVMATVFAIPVTSLIYYCFWNHRYIALLSMLLLPIGLFALLDSPVVPGTIMTIVIVWFVAHRYLSRNAPKFDAPMANTIEIFW